MDDIVLIRSCENNRKYAPIVSIIVLYTIHIHRAQHSIRLMLASSSRLCTPAVGVRPSTILL